MLKNIPYFIFKQVWVQQARNYELRVKLWRALWQLIVYSEKQYILYSGL